jgi:hypothetical protein
MKRCVQRNIKFKYAAAVAVAEHSMDHTEYYEHANASDSCNMLSSDIVSIALTQKVLLS